MNSGPPYRGSALVVKTSALLELLVKLAPWGVLQDQEDSRAIVEVVVKLKDVGMPKQRVEYQHLWL